MVGWVTALPKRKRPSSWLAPSRPCVWCEANESENLAVLFAWISEIIFPVSLNVVHVYYFSIATVIYFPIATVVFFPIVTVMCKSAAHDN